ncbi:MAG: sensor histidine kinase [Aeromonas sp.]
MRDHIQTSVTFYLAGLLLLCPLWGFAAPRDPRVDIGVLATHGIPAANHEWQPLMRWLTEQLPHHRFILHPLDLDQLADAVATHTLDFVITNPGQSVTLSRQYPLAWLATLKTLDQQSERAIGAALVVKADSPFLHWQDLENQPIAAVSENAFGGYLAYRFEARQQGIRLNHFFSAVSFTGFPLDRLIERVASGSVSAAIVPVCQLERMVREGKIADQAFRVLDNQAPAGFDCQSSTRLYPNWSFAKTERASPQLALAVTRALFALPEDHLAAIAAQSTGWTVPTSELSIDRLLRALDRHPLQQPLWQAGWRWLQLHQQWGWGALLLIMLLAGYHLLLQYLFHRSQQRLLTTRAQLTARLQQLERARHLAQLGELGANIAHEINQPLAAIANFSQGALLRLAKSQPQGSTDLVWALQQIGQQVDRIALTIARVRAQVRKQPRSAVKTDLMALVVDLTPLLEQILAPLDVALTVNWHGQPRPLLLDGTGMEQLLVNLVKNGAESAASQYQQTGGTSAYVTIDLTFEPDHLLLDIADNGTGLPAPQVQLFENFYSSKPDGMGLGLAICRDLVEFHQGEFSLTDRQPHGCLARVRLPLPAQSCDAITSRQ